MNKGLKVALGIMGVSAGALLAPEAMAAAESYATDTATYISGDGKLTVMAVVTATAGIAAILWVVRKLGFR